MSTEKQQAFTPGHKYQYKLHFNNINNIILTFSLYTFELIAL